MGMSNRTFIINANVISGYASLQDCGILVQDGIIEDLFNMSRFSSKKVGSADLIFDAEGNTVCPGLIDSHIHGIGGFGTEDNSVDSILGMSKTLAQFGVTAFLPTIYPNGRENLFAAEEAIVNAMGKEEGARILGINVEGPFISPKRSGALPKNSISPVDLDYFDQIVAHGHGKVVCMTVAPEIKGMRELALHARKAGVVLLAGHTDATYNNMVEGMQCGIMHSTHFFNAMSRLHHREPGAVGAILIHPEICCEIIADGVHVNKELVKLVVRNKPDENIVLITDSLKPNQQKEGRLFANDVEVVLSSEGAFVSKEDPSLLNGSALTLNRAIHNMKTWGIAPDVTIQMATENPARIYSFRDIGAIIPDNKADIVVFDEKFNALTVFVGGKIVYNAK